jgi:serine/threonine-protein kinase RsbW
VRGACAGLRLAIPDLDALELCVAEAINNVIEHAYRGAPGPVEVEISSDGPALEIVVIDEGIEMERGWLREAATPLEFEPSDRDSLPEGGMGLHLIRALTHSARYERRAGRNLLTLVYRPGASRPG